MAQYTSSFFGVAIPTSFGQSEVGFNAQSITIYNNTPAQLAVFGSEPGPGGSFPFGGIPVPAFYPITIPVIGWRGYWILTDKTVTFAASSLVVFLTDQPLTGQPLSPFGPSGWGAGADPASLTQINPGDALLAWQVRQFYLLLTGQLPGQVTQFAGNVELRQSDLVLYSKNVPANVKKFLVGSGNQLQFYADDGTTLLASLDENGRWTVPATGASAKPLLNVVALNPPVLTTLTGTGNKASTAFTVNGLPSSAVLAALLVDWTTPTIGGTIILYHDTLSTVPGLITRTNVAFNAGDTGGLMAVAPGATNQLAYNVGGLGAGDNWTAQIYAQAYAEAS